MTRSPPTALAAALLLALPAFALPAFAQPAPPPAPAAPPASAYGAHEWSGHDGSGHDWADREGGARHGAARRLADLHAMLGITPAQEGAWQAFVAAHRPPEDEAMRAHTEALARHAQAMAAGGAASEADREAMRREGEEIGRRAHAMAQEALAEHGMGEDMQALPLPERLERMQQLAQRREAMTNARLSRLLTATRGLYAVLTPDQKRILDHMPMPMLEVHMAMGGHGDWAGHGHMPPMPPAPPAPGAAPAPPAPPPPAADR